MSTLLRAEGLEQFYDLGGRSLGAVGAVPRVPPFDWLPELEQRHRQVDGTVLLTLDVQGIRCEACVWLLQQLWRRQPGARALRLDASLGRAALVYEASAGTAARFLARAAALGYPMAPPRRRAERDTGLLLRLGITMALAMNAMILAFASYFGLGGADALIDRVFGWVSLALATLSVAIGGPVFFRGAIAGLRTGVLHMDLPISLGLLLAYGGSVHGLLTGGAVWFDTVAMFVALMLLGRFVQQRTVQQNRDQMLADDGAEHLRARRLALGVVELVPIARVNAGDELVLAPGDLVPVRGNLLGDAACSLDWINGESEPRTFRTGDAVPAGAFVAGRKPVRMVATADYIESGLALLLEQPPVDRDDPRHRARFWSNWSRAYTLAVLAAALVGALVWLAIEPARALPVAIAVLVVTCPCAIGLAAPLAFHLALARLRRAGVFVRSQTLLEKLARVRKVVFDKTGTLTFGGLRAESAAVVPPSLRPLIATMAASSNHPASQAVLAAIGPEASFDTAIAVEEIAGAGLVANRDGEEFRLGSPRFCGVAAGSGRECVFCGRGEVVRFVLTEDYRAGAADELRQLQQRGLEVHVLSGDREDRVAAAAQQLGLDAGRAHGGMSPQAKAEFVAALDADDTLMIGDGLNDAPAFAAAFCAGTPAMDRPVLPARADFYFRGATAGAVASVFAVAARHRQVTISSVTLALLYNGAAMLLALCGVASPLGAAIAMPISSLLLLAHTTWRLGGRGGQP